jgi:hypothetical protein
MSMETQSFVVRVQTRHAGTELPLASINAEAVADEDGNGEHGDRLATGRTGADGRTVIELPREAWGRRLTVRVIGQHGLGVPITLAMLTDEETAILDVQATDRVDTDVFALVADHMVALFYRRCIAVSSCVGRSWISSTQHCSGSQMRRVARPFSTRRRSNPGLLLLSI